MRIQVQKNDFRIEIIGPSSPSRAHVPGPTGQLRWVASQEQLLHANDPFNMDVLTIFFYIPTWTSMK